MQEKKQCYFLQIFKKGYVLSGLFFGLLFSTFLVFTDSLGLFYNIVNNPVKLISELFTLGFFALILLIYMFAKLRSKKYCVADTLYIALFFTGAVWLVYSLIVKGVIILDLIVGAVMIFLAIFMLVIACIFRDSTCTTIKICTRKGFFRYFYAIANKFSFPAIYVGALTIACIWYLIVARIVPLTDMVGNVIFFAICLVPTLIYLAASLGSKKISLVDGALLASIIAMPVVIVQTLFTLGTLVYMQSSLILMCAFIGAVLLFTLMRAVNVSTKYQAQKELEAIKNDGGNYFVRLAKKYNIFSMASIAGIITILPLVAFSPLDYAKYITGIYFLPYATINLVCIAVLAIGELMAIIHSGSDEIGLGDFAFGVNFFACILMGISLAFNFNIITLGGFALELVLNVAVLVAKIMHASKPKIKKQQLAE